jgi:hypothetical protein
MVLLELLQKDSTVLDYRLDLKVAWYCRKEKLSIQMNL